MQAQRRRLFPCSSPFAELSASGPPEMHLPEFVDDTRDGTFQKDISTGSLLGLLRHSHGYHQFVQGERLVRGFRRAESCPGDGQALSYRARFPISCLPTIRELLHLVDTIPFYKKRCQDKYFSHDGKTQGKWSCRPAQVM